MGLVNFFLMMIGVLKALRLGHGNIQEKNNEELISGVRFPIHFDFMK
jgi:hypothetical protein